MKNTIKLIGFIVFVSIIGLSFAACNNDDNGEILQFPIVYHNTVWNTSPATSNSFFVGVDYFNDNGFLILTYRIVRKSTVSEVADGYDVGFIITSGTGSNYYINFKSDGSSIRFNDINLTKQP